MNRYVVGIRDKDKEIEVFADYATDNDGTLVFTVEKDDVAFFNRWDYCVCRELAAMSAYRVGKK